VFTEKTHDVGAGKSGHGMVHPAWIELPQVGRMVENHIESPLVPVSRPVIRRWGVNGRSPHESG
jgi:hypothetical protein